jgi:hypothetical protein
VTFQHASKLDDTANNNHVTSLSERSGISFGCAIGSLDDMAAASLQAVKEGGGARRLSPFFIPKILLNLVGGRAAIRHAMQVSLYVFHIEMLLRFDAQCRGQISVPAQVSCKSCSNHSIL